MGAVGEGQKEEKEMRVRGYRVRTDLARRKGDVASREVGKMRQGREGLLSSRGPFARVWGPFRRKGGVVLA